MCLGKKTPPLFPGLISWSNVLSTLSCSFCGIWGSSPCSWQPHPSCRAYWNPPLLFFVPHGEQSALQQTKGQLLPRGLCYSSKLPGGAWGHEGHNKGHSESPMWHLSSVNATLDLAPSSIFMCGVQIEAQEWEAAIKKRKIMDCLDVPDAETLRRKETEDFKLCFFDSEELWVEPGAGWLLTFPPFCLYQYPVPCLSHTLWAGFAYFWGVLWEKNVVIFALPHSLV